jgi:hypothetical protein
VDQVKPLHILQGKAVQHKEHVAPDAALVGAQENPVAGALLHGHPGRAVGAYHLLALGQLHALLLEGGDYMLGLLVGAEDAHIGAALGAQLFGKHREIHRVATGIHGLDVLIFIDYVVAKTQNTDLIASHRAFPP